LPPPDTNPDPTNGNKGNQDDNAAREPVQHINKLEQKDSRLKQQLAAVRKDSSTSSKPPSSDIVKPKKPRGKGGKKRKRGAQRGHKRHRRDLVPPEKVSASFDIKPQTCRGCGAALLGDDPEPLRHQVAELPPIEPVVTEYRLHRLICEECGEKTCGQLPVGVPRGAFGPRLQAVLSLLAGAYRLGKRVQSKYCADL
jgi:transposase